MSISALRAQIRRVGHVTLRAGHRLLVMPDDESFVDEVVQRLAQARPAGPAAQADDAVARAIRFCFCRRLHAAYRQDGSDEQARAFQSAQAILYPMLLARLDGNADRAAELTQEVLWQAWRSVRRQPLDEPGAFLAYLVQAGVRLTFREPREAAPDSGPGSSLDEDTWELPAAAAAVDSVSTEARPVEAELEASALAGRLLVLVRRCLDNERYWRLIDEHILGGKTFKELAQAWQCTASSLYMAKFHALEKLRHCEELLNFVRQEAAAWVGPLATGSAA